MSNPRHQPGRPLTPAEMNAFLKLRATYERPIAAEEQAGVRAVYRYIALRDGRDDERHAGHVHMDFVPEPTEREQAWVWGTEDLEVTVRCTFPVRYFVLTPAKATVHDRQTDSLTFIVSLRPDYSGNTVNPKNMKTFIHMPRSLMHGGKLRPGYEGLDELLKEMLFDCAGYSHVARFHCRLARAGLWTGQPRPLPISPNAPRRRVVSSPAAPAPQAAPRAHTQPSPSPSPAPRTRTLHASTAPRVVRGEQVPLGVHASHPALHARRVPPHAIDTYTPHPTCAVCAVNPDLASLASGVDLAGQRVDAAGKIAILAAPAKGGLDQPRCPFLFAELGLDAHDEEEIIRATKAFPEDALYAALVAMGLCVFHTCRIVETVIADWTAGHEILTFRS